MARRNTTLIILLVCCICSSSMSSGWPSLLASAAAAFGASTTDKREDKQASPEGMVCIGNRADSDYQSGCKRKSRFADYLLGLQGSCNEGDTMIAYDSSNCADGSRRAYCKRGLPDSTWNYKVGDDCKLPYGAETDCKVTLYEKPDFEGNYMELDRSLNALQAPYSFSDMASSIKVEGNCKKVLLHKDYNRGGTVYDPLGDDSPENAGFIDFDNKARSITIE